MAQRCFETEGEEEERGVAECGKEVEASVSIGLIFQYSNYFGLD